ncbi:MAG TPA: TerC family protein [Methylomirabilota bacterium]|jgi:YjbE family integral membrane protein|nr:TerC family protein [Methylomirabilota bacterium]
MTAVVIDLGYLTQVGKIVLLDLVLAGDNAVVIALAVRTLPRRQQFWGRIWGTFGAVALRLAFIFVVTWLLKIPLLQVAGALMLVWIALKLVRQSEGESGGHKVRQGTSVFEAVWIIIVADVIMSLDNVLSVAGAAHGDMQLVVFGIGLSIPIVIWLSAVLSALMNRFPWIVWLAAGVLGEVAGKMILDDVFVVERFGHPHWMVHVALRLPLAVLLTLAGWWFSRAAAARQTAEHA